MEMFSEYYSRGRIVDFYKKVDTIRLDREFFALRDLGFLIQLEDSDAMLDRISPANLRDRLVSLACREYIDHRAQRFIHLARSSLYSEADSHGRMRRFDLIYAMGFIDKPQQCLYDFFDNVMQHEPRYRYAACAALVKIGTIDSLAILWNRVFYPVNSVSTGQKYHNTVVEVIKLLAEYKERPLVADFMNNFVAQTPFREIAMSYLQGRSKKNRYRYP